MANAKGQSVTYLCHVSFSQHHVVYWFLIYVSDWSVVIGNDWYNIINGRISGDRGGVVYRWG